MGFALGSTVTGGIQDISALLPLLGTEQCEKHVGSSLVHGFLYVAATPLSIFGSLGIVLAGIKALVASVVFGLGDKKVMGAETLADMGFESSEDVLSYIMWKDGCHVAETELAKALKELHITDMEKLTVDAATKRWNWLMLSTSLSILILSITPYVFLIKHTDSDLLSLRLFFPLARSIGSLVVSIMIQILIQTRLLEIVKYRIVFLTVNDSISDEHVARLSDARVPFSQWWNTRLSSEAALYRLRRFLQVQKNGAAQKNHNISPKSFLCRLGKCIKLTGTQGDVENSDPQLESLKAELNKATEKHFAPTSHFRLTMLVAQLSIACGISLTVVGYIGCFSLVQSSSNSFGPLIWLLAEVALSLVRMGLWGWNPPWDEKQTHLMFSLKLADHIPLSTCNTFYEDLEEAKQIPLTPSDEFLGSITSFVGSLEPLTVADGDALYYTMTRRRSDGQQVLYATMVDYRVNISWTLVCPGRSGSRIDCRMARVHLKGDDISTVWAELCSELPMDDAHGTMHAIALTLEAHCDSILRKLRPPYTLAQGLSEVLSEERQNRVQELKTALMDGTKGGFNIREEEASERLSMSLEWRLLDVLGAVNQGPLTGKLYDKALSQTEALRRALEQGRSRKQDQSWDEVQMPAQSAKQALREVLGLSPQNSAKKRLETVKTTLAEVVVLGLVLEQRQEQEGQLTKAVAAVVALLQDEDEHEALDRALILVLVLKLLDGRVRAGAMGDVRVEVGAQAQAQHMRAEWMRAQAQTRPGRQAEAEDRTRFIAKAMATTLKQLKAHMRTVEQAQGPWRKQYRPPLNIGLTWALKRMEEAKTPTVGHPDYLRPLTEDDLADITHIKTGELELPKERLCSKMHEWMEEGFSFETLSPRDEFVEWAKDYGLSREAIVEILMLVGRYQLEGMLVEESSELEDILRRHNKEMTAVLEDRRSKDEEYAAQKIACYDRKAFGQRRVTDEAERVQVRLKQVGQEARVRIKRGGHSEQTASFLESQWGVLQDHITQAWSRIISNIEYGVEARIEAHIYTSNTLCTLVQPQNRAQMKAWLEHEQERMKEQLRKAHSDGYHEFLQESGNSGASMFLVRLLLSKTSNLVQLPFSSGEEPDFVSLTRILGLNATASCVDLTACTVLEVIDIVRSSWKTTGVTLIVSTEVLHDPKLERALRENKNILSLNSLDATSAIQANRMAAEHSLIQSDTDRPLVYYECVEIADDSPYLVFKQPGKSRCTVLFSVSDKYLAHKAETGQLTLRLMHCRTNSHANIDIHLNGDAGDILWVPEMPPQDEFGVQDIVLPRGKLFPGLNRLTITLRGPEDEDKGEGQQGYRLRNVQLVWPPSISTKSKLLQLDSGVVGGNVIDSISNVLGESTIVSCYGRTLDQVIEIIDLLSGVKSLTLLRQTFDGLTAAEVAHLQTTLQNRPNVLSLSYSIPDAIKPAIESNRMAAEKNLVSSDEPLVYYEDVYMDDNSSYMGFTQIGDSKCTVLFSVPADETAQGAVTGQMILRLVHWRFDPNAEVSIRLNGGTSEVPWDQENCPEGTFDVQDVVLPSDMYSQGVNTLTVTLTKCDSSEYRMKDVQLVWVEEVSLKAKFVRSHPKMVTEHNFVSIANALGFNTVVSCIDCTACTVDELIRIITTFLKARSVTLIISPQLLYGPEADVTRLVLALMYHKHVLSLNCSHDPNDIPDSLKQVIEDNRTGANNILQSGNSDQPLVFYECVEIDENSSHLVFQQPSKSRCTVSFFVPAHGSVVVILRLVHCRTTAGVKADILLNGATEIPWDQENCPRDGFGMKDIVLPGDALDAGVNTLTITLRSDSDGAYQMKGVWPLSIGKEMKFLQLGSNVVWGNATDAIPSVLGASTVVSCWGRTLGQVIEILDFLRGVKSLILRLGLVLDDLVEADIVCLQTALRDHQNILSLVSTTKLARDFPQALQQALQANRAAAENTLKRGGNDGPFVYYEDVHVDFNNSYISFPNDGDSQCIVLFSVPAQETGQGALTGQLILRLVHWRMDSDAVLTICLNDTNEVPWDQLNCPEGAFGEQDVVLPSNMLSPGVNTLTITFTVKESCYSWYRMKDVQLVWLEAGKEPEEGQNLDGEVGRSSRWKRWGQKWRTGRQETTSPA